MKNETRDTIGFVIVFFIAVSIVSVAVVSGAFFLGQSLGASKGTAVMVPEDVTEKYNACISEVRPYYDRLAARGDDRNNAADMLYRHDLLVSIDTKFSACVDDLFLEKFIFVY